MMRARLIDLAERRARLTGRAGTEREALARLVARGDAAAAWLETARRLFAELKHRPLLVAAAVALVTALRPKRIFKLLAGGWSLWRLYRSARRWWMRIAAAAEVPVPAKT